MHLLYARFWHKVLFDLGHVSTPEPFYKLVNQGLILGEDGTENVQVPRQRGEPRRCPGRIRRGCLPLEANLSKIQNICYELLQTAYNSFQHKGEEGGQSASAWINHFRALAEKLSLHVE